MTRLLEPAASWAATVRELQRLAEQQFFFIGGAPRSGTTWLQMLLDRHPEISCRGEGLFRHGLADPLDGLIANWRQAIADKNQTVFAETGGYELPPDSDADFLLGSAILRALARQTAGRNVRAVGEKTPENVFFFPRLKRIFPAAKFIGIARDPRDTLASAWHYFHSARGAVDEDAGKLDFIRSALPSIANGARTMLALVAQHPADAMIVTYESLSADPTTVAGRLFGFLGVSDDAATVADCVARTSFTALAGQREEGAAHDGSFFRKGAPGDWRSAFTPEMGDLIVAELRWTFPHFGWRK